MLSITYLMVRSALEARLEPRTTLIRNPAFRLCAVGWLFDGSTLRSRPFPDHRRRRCRAGAAQFARPGAACRGAGYRRFWMAEHHNLPGIASAATAVALAHVAAGTNHIRIGAGGIMLPNHAPLLDRRTIRHSRRAASGAGRAGSRPRARFGSGHRARRAPGLARRRGKLSAGSRRADGLFPTRRTGSSGCGGARRRARGADLDSRVQPLRRAGRGLSRAALCLRLAFRAGDDDGRDEDLPRSASARPRNSLRPMSCSGSLSSPRNPTRRRGTCIRHCSNPR